MALGTKHAALIRKSGFSSRLCYLHNIAQCSRPVSLPLGISVFFTQMVKLKWPVLNRSWSFAKVTRRKNLLPWLVLMHQNVWRKSEFLKQKEKFRLNPRKCFLFGGFSFGHNQIFRIGKMRIKYPIHLRQVALPLEENLIGATVDQVKFTKKNIFIVIWPGERSKWRLGWVVSG